MAIGIASGDRVLDLIILSGLVLSLGQPLPSPETSHSPLERHVETQGQRQEQDGQQASVFRFCIVALERVSSHPSKYDVCHFGCIHASFLHGEKRIRS